MCKRIFAIIFISILSIFTAVCFIYSNSQLSYAVTPVKHELDNYAAHDDFSINEWKPNYYVAHEYSPAGYNWKQCDVGDVIPIESQNILVKGKIIGQYDTDTATYENVVSTIPSESYCFQTCYGNNGYLILYGVKLQ